MKRWGLPEYLGIAVSLVCIVWWSPINDYLAGPKLLVLVAAGLGAVPAIIYRWRQALRPRGLMLLVPALALGLVAWACLSMLFSGAPLPVSLLGWWGRSNGLLSLVAAALLMLAATTLRRDEIPRVVSWLLIGATVIALIGLGQLTGNQITGGKPDPTLMATMGNINFSAAYFAIMALLAAGRALTQGSPNWQRAGAGLLAILLAGLSILTTATQGPAALGVGAIAMLVLWALAYHGERRRFAIVVASAVVVLSAAIVFASFFGLGPLASLWQDINFRVRQGTWQTAWNVAQAMPIFGTGPDGLQRYAAQYAPDFYVEIIGPGTSLSAAHNVPLQYAATLGLAAGVLWLLMMMLAGALLFRTMAREAVPQTTMAASVGGAFAAYLTQAMVSIDVGGLLATGWLLLGMVTALSIAPARSRASSSSESRSVQSGASDVEARRPVADKRGIQANPRKVKSATRTRGPQRAGLSQDHAPIWVPIAGVLLGLVGIAVVMPSLAIDARVSQTLNLEELASMLESPWTPCDSRMALTQMAVAELGPQQGAPLTYAAADLDHRCGTMANFQADLAVQNGQADVAGRATVASITYNPDDVFSWILRARYHLMVGDLPAAESDYETAVALVDRFPGNDRAGEILQRLRTDLDASKDSEG